MTPASSDPRTLRLATLASQPTEQSNSGTRIRDTAQQDRAIDTAPRRRRRRVIVSTGVLAVLALVMLAYPALERFAGAQTAVPISRLRLAQVQSGDFVRDLAVDGTVVAAASPTLFAPADGTVTFEVVAGDRVRAGDVLATVDSPELANRLEQEVATLQGLEIGLARQAIEKKTRELRNQQSADMARVDVVAAERELRRAEASHAVRAISLQDYEKARDDVDKARLEYRHAVDNAALESESMSFELETMALQRDRQRLLMDNLRRQVEELAVRSPVDGIVGSLVVEQKAAVARNAPLLTVVDLSALEIEIKAPESYSDDLRAGLEAQVSFAGATHPALITAVSPEVRDNQVTGRMRFTGEVPAGLRQNQRVTARVVLEMKPATLTVQRGPFLDSGGGRVAYVVEQGIAQRRAIRIGSTSIREVEILEGLAAGETIVISSLSQFEGADTVLLTD